MGTLRNSVFLWRRGILSLLIFSFAIGFTFAQGRVVKGKVTSATEGPLPGVNIVLQGTTTGTMSDAGGNYTINVPGPETVLVFSFISYTTQAITVGTQATIDVVLAPAMSALNEVVVTGYGTQKKREVTSSITSVKSDEFNKGSVNSPVALIEGKVSGLSISKPGGNPNGTYDIRLRGMSTIGANLGPLVIIDGVIGGDLNNVDPNDIESINVLKDGSAAAIYGTRGSSGVILVQTKKGKKGTAVIDYNVYASAEMVAKNTNVMTAAQWRAMSGEVGLGKDFGFSTDWFKQIEQTAFSQTHNLAMSGGSDKTSYRASVNYRNNEGIMITTGNQQLNGRINLTQKALNDKFTLDVNLGATENNKQLGHDDAFRYASIYNPTAPVMSRDTSINKDFGTAKYAGYFQQVLFDYYNPVAILKLDQQNQKDRLLNVSAKASYEIVKGLSIDAFYSFQTANQHRMEYMSKYDYFGGLNRNGLATVQDDNQESKLFESTVHYMGDVTSALNLTLLGGYSYQEFVNDESYLQAGNFLTDNFTVNNLAAALDWNNGKGTVTSYKNSNKLIAFFGRVNLNINSTFFVSASARYEGSSRFGSANKWGLFPAIGGGADLSKMINIDFIDNLKVRVNYGITGNQPKDSYLSLLRLGPQGNFFYNGTFVPGYSPVSNANTDLKWEKKGEFDAGFDFSVFNSKLSGSFDFYTRTTKDLLFQYGVPVPPNLYNQAWLNLGKIKSSGLELTLNYNVIRKGDFNYSIALTPSYILENTLVSLSGTFNGAELKYGRQELADMGSPGQNGTPIAVVEEGKPLGQILSYVYEGIDASGKFIFKDVNGDGSISAADRTVTGNGLPKFLIGFGNTLTYKNWDLNIFFRGVFGHDLVNSFRAFYEVPAYITSYNLPKTTTDLRSPDGKLLAVTSGTLSSKYVEKADFVSLDNMALGYNFTLPKSSVFSKIRLYLAGNNLFYITKYTGVDPNPRYTDSDRTLGTFDSPLVTGIDRRNTWFRTRSVTFGANFVF
jgi:iron complex outermembrane receptor protein